jgi:hypothetical protein
MRSLAKAFCLGLVLLVAVVSVPPAEVHGAADLEKIYFAVEVNGVVCGYSEVGETVRRRGGRKVIEQVTDIFVMLSVLGSRVNSAIQVTTLLDASTRATLSSDIRIDQGGSRHAFSLQVTDGEAVLNSSLRGDVRRFSVTPKLLVGDEEVFRMVKREFACNHSAEVRCDMLEPVEQEVSPVVFRKTGEERIELAGKVHVCLVIEQDNARTGVKTTYWLDPGCDFFVKLATGNRVVSLSDRRVADRIKVSNVDADFFTKTNVTITDVTAIRYMKLQVNIKPTGAILSAAELNVPGQSFSGTVTDNLINGILEIEQTRYDGKGAPPFPPTFAADPGLEKYLASASFIESEDPVLVRKAREITAGSADSWQAATRLSRWVSENIGYAVPGGGTARKTYDIRAGDCGAHSMLLAAFCRAVGIPARVVFGALYVPNHGGGFGQHGWNEIYMGEAGWIPVDSTMGEIDFIDSGHIRVMELQSVGSNKFNGRDIRVLEHRMAEKSSRPSASAAADLARYLGTYVHLRKGRTFTILEKDGNLVLDVPGRFALPFSLPDEQGRWRCALVPRIYLVFNGDGAGTVRELVVHEVASMPRRGPHSSANPGIPAQLAFYTGTYYFAAKNAELTVLVQDGRLAVYDPGDKTTALFRPTAQAGEWLDDNGFVTISFELDDQGQAAVLKIDTADTFLRGVLASAIVEREIADSGIEAGLDKFRALKAAPERHIHFSEESFNLLAYRLLNAGKMAEAVSVFKLIVQEYPRSSNAWGCLAEAYVKNGQNDLAIESYKKALLLDPKNERARQRIAELQGR